MKSLILSRNGLVILALLLIVMLADWLGAFETGSFSLYDEIRMLGAPPVSNVLVVAIDEHTLANVSNYPLASKTHLRLLENLVSAGVGLVGYAGLPALNSVFVSSDDTLASPITDGQQLDRITSEIRDKSLVVAGIPFVAAKNSDLLKPELPAYVLQNSMSNDHSLNLFSARSAYPLPETAGGPATYYASILVDNDNGKIVRSTPLFVEAGGQLIPSLALQLYLRANDLSLSDVNISTGNSVTVAGSPLASDQILQMWPYFYPASARDTQLVDVISYHDVLHGAVAEDQLSGKIVLLGVTARGLTPAVRTPAESSVSPVMLAANTLASMLGGKIIAIPAWASSVTTVVLILIAVLLLWLLSQNLTARIIVTAVFGLILLGMQALFMLEASVWLDMFPSVLLLLTGFIATGLMGSRQPRTEKTSVMSGEVHRRVGLASQKRGELDAAFESFRKCPLDNSIMVLLFYLAQDFENEGRYDRAVAVYQYMESYNPHFTDLQGRLEKARMMEDTVSIDQSKIVPDVNTAITSLDPVEGSEEESTGQRMLGRYQVEQEIGKGAMGMVYQGRDPKINRTVAIKTLNLKREFDEDEQENVLGRFFHEAEAAGRLHHPHIVTIYDAGEHDELAYIAMEFLTGSDLRIYTKKGTLLPPLTVVKMGMKLADGLAYAHGREIIHRDIKAANVMYDPGTGQLKITDFGIARLTDSRRTKTGMVLGTPSSMSPEQLRGKKLDGRTDLYSLGVLMFQLLTGRLPYKAESLTQLMYKITNEPPPDLFVLRPDLKENGACIREIIDKLLQKDADDRYQDGKKLARDMLACAKKMAGKKQ